MHPAERGELEAFRDLYAVAPDGLGASAGEVGGAFCLRLEAAPTSGMFNRALGLGLREPASEGGIGEIASFFGDGIGWCLALSPQAEPPEVPSWLERLGFTRGYGWAKFSRCTDDAPETQTDLRIERVKQGDAFADAFVRGYGTPDFFRGWVSRLAGRDGWHCFVAFDRDTPAATGALFVSGTVGWLGIAATVPEYRRRGAQGAILSARLEAAREAGCEIVVTETGELQEGRPSSSYRNIVRAGFEEAYVRPNYLSSAEADTSGTAAS
jgi:GNAT superfamily N-acetyltransferase